MPYCGQLLKHCQLLLLRRYHLEKWAKHYEENTIRTSEQNINKMVSLVEAHVNKKYEEDTTSRTSWICEQSIMKKILLRDVEKNIKKVSLDKWTKHMKKVLL